MIGALRPYLRHAAHACGPAAVAIAHFVTSLQMVGGLSLRDFGTFALLLLLAQVALMIQNALAATPLTVRPGGTEDPLVPVLIRVALVQAVVCLAVPAVILGLEAAMFGLYVALALLRGLALALAHAGRRPGVALRSDVAYAVMLTGCILALPQPSISAAMACLCLASGAGLILAAQGFVGALAMALRNAHFRGYGTIWQQQSRWALLGVASTEATVNAHAYAIALVCGPAAYAPLAAVALMFRPVGLLGQALTQLERPAFVRADATAAGKILRQFRRSMIMGWGGTALLAVTLLAIAPGLIFPPTYDAGVLWIATVAWIVLSGLRALRSPESAFLQAQRRFHPLARASVTSASVAVPAVILLLITLGPVATMGRLILGEAVFAHRLKRIRQGDANV